MTIFLFFNLLTPVIISHLCVMSASILIKLSIMINYAEYDDVVTFVKFIDTCHFWSSLFFNLASKVKVLAIFMK